MILHFEMHFSCYEELYTLFTRNQMAEQLGNQAINQKVAGSIPGQDK